MDHVDMAAQARKSFSLSQRIYEIDSEQISQE